jgi:hypothetical protein
VTGSDPAFQAPPSRPSQATPNVAPSGAPSQANAPVIQQQQNLAPRNFGGQDPRRDQGRNDQGRNEQGRNFGNLSRHPGLAASGAAGANVNALTVPNTAFAPQINNNARQLRGAPPGFRTANEPSPARALRNQTFANPARLAGRAALANTTFRGRFAANRSANSASAGQQRFHRHRVLGWYGRTFWPYAYYDMFTTRSGRMPMTRSGRTPTTTSTAACSGLMRMATTNPLRRR